MHQIEFHDEAENELNAAAQYYEEREQGLGDEFLREAEEGMSRIQKLPLAWPIYEDPYRRYLLKRFPYSLVYRIGHESIFIIAVAHLHREQDTGKVAFDGRQLRGGKVDAPSRRVSSNGGRMAKRLEAASTLGRARRLSGSTGIPDCCREPRGGPRRLLFGRAPRRPPPSSERSPRGSAAG